MKLTNEHPALRFGILVMLGWLVYFVVAPTVGFGWGRSWHNEQRVIQVALLVLTSLTAAWHCAASGPAVPKVGIHGLLALVLLLGILSSAMARFPSEGFGEVALAGALISCAVCVSQFARTWTLRWTRWLAAGALAAGAAYVTGAATNYVAALNLGQSIDVEVVLLGYRNPRFPSATHALLIPLMLWLTVLNTERRSVRAAAFVIASLLWTINLALATRGIWVAVGAAALACWLIGGRPTRRLTTTVAASAVAGMVAYWILFQAVPNLGSAPEALQSRAGDIASLSKRDRLWSAAVDMALRNPWFGAGPMHFATEPALEFSHPHSWPLQVASEWGVPALIALLLLLGLFLTRCVRALADDDRKAVPVGLAPIFFAATVALTYGLFDGNWVMPVSQSANAIVLGSLVGLLPRRLQSPPPSSWRLFVATACLASAYLAGFTASGLARQTVLEGCYRVQTRQLEFAPRFWQQGYISVTPCS